MTAEANRRTRPRLTVLTGAGISAESGLSTFRGKDGLWEGFNIYEVASYEGWIQDPALVLAFYNARRRQLQHVVPNKAHQYLVELEDRFDVSIVTQNVDDLHERAGSSQVYHLHGELLKARSTLDPTISLHWSEDITLSDRCPLGSQLRPDIVWFGEAVPMMDIAIELTRTAHLVIVIGTSLQVYPAANLINVLGNRARLIYVDPEPAGLGAVSNEKYIINKTAVEAIPELHQLISQLLENMEL